MIAVIFEVWLTEGEKQHYLDIAAYLRAELETIDGFLSIERFQSISNPEKMLSLSFFRNEEAVRAWRNTLPHRTAQVLGRSGVFSDYRLHIAHVIRDYGLLKREEALTDSRDAHSVEGSSLG